MATKIKSYSYTTPIVLSCVDDDGKQFETIVYYDIAGKQCYVFDENLSDQEIIDLSHQLAKKFDLPTYDDTKLCQSIASTQFNAELTANQAIEKAKTNDI